MKRENLLKWIRRHPVLFVANLLFLAWFVFLLVFHLQSARYVRFYDVLAQEDVSDQYFSELPIIRYFFEPLSGTIFSLGQDFDWLIGFVIVYALFRLFYLILKRVKKNRVYSNPVLLLLRDGLYFTLRYSFSLLLGILGYLGILFWQKGFFPVANQYSLLLHLWAYISVTIFSVRMVRNLFVLKNGEGARLRKPDKPTTNSIWKVTRFGLHEIWALMSLICLLATSIITLSTINLPTHRIETQLDVNAQGQQTEFLFDFHVHTSKSDGFLTPQQRVEWYLDQGIHGAAFSDHHNVRGSIIARDYVQRKNLDFKVFMAQEFTDDPEGLHLNVYGIEEDLSPKNYYNSTGPNMLNAEEMIKYVKDNGGYVTVNHYGSNASEPFTYNQLMMWGVDGFELLNDGDIYDRGIREFCLENDLACMGGSDIHGNYELNTFVKLRLEDPTNITLDSVFAQLKKNEHEVVQIKLQQEKVTEDVLGLKDFANYMLNINVFQMLSWWVWSVIAYILFVYSYRKLRTIQLNAPEPA